MFMNNYNTIYNVKSIKVSTRENNILGESV